jgi:hypothetical protein
MKLLNEHPVLDKGYVALHSCGPSGLELVELSKEFFRGRWDDRLLNTGVAHLKIKCPLFVQLCFQEHGLMAVTKRSDAKPEAFIPNVSQVNAQNLEASEAIQRDIQQTTEALLLNPKAYQMEHCDLFVSQVISPVSVYNVLIVSGSLTQWLSFLSQRGLPSPIEAYRKATENVLFAEFAPLREKLEHERQRQRN